MTLQRKTRTVAQWAALKYKQAAPIGIGATMRCTAARKRRAQDAVIQGVRRAIWATRSACQLCQGQRRAECAGFPDEMHEHVPRSLTRRMAPEHRFSLKNCSRLCKCCHADVTAHRLRIVFADRGLGFLGHVWAEKVER